MRQTAAILLSRQPLRPCGLTGWVRKSQETVRRIKEDKLTLLTSTGLQTWEILTALASINRIPLRLYLMAVSEEDFNAQKEYYIDQFELVTKLTTFVQVMINGDEVSKEKSLALRDERIISDADLLIPVSVKKKGNIERWLKKYPDKEILNDFKIDYEKRQEPLAYEIAPDKLNPETRSIGNHYLIHWTRTFNNAWPNERLIDYYRDIMANQSYPRSAFQTLKRILKMKIISATNKNMPGGIPTVSFSASSPDKLLPLMKWRARYRQMTFEPYGIGIRKEVALEKGVMPVRYYDKKQPLKKDNDYMWLYQSKGRITDWRQEAEFRFKGDFSFEDIPSQEMLAVCLNKKEARMLSDITGIKTLSFTD